MTAKKKPKPKSKTYWKKRADKAFSLYIRNRDQVCQANRTRPDTCESPYHLQCAHIVTRSYSATRLDATNAVALCRSCHMHYTHRPLEWEQFVTTELMTEDDFYRLKVRALAGARRAHAIDWEEEAAYWESA